MRSSGNEFDPEREQRRKSVESFRAWRKTREPEDITDDHANDRTNATAIAIGESAEASVEYQGAAGQGGAYTLSVSQVDITDDHSSYMTSATLIEPGRSVEGSLEYERDMDVFRFQGEADKLYKIYLLLKTLEKASLFLDFANGEELTNTYGEAPSLRLD